MCSCAIFQAPSGSFRRIQVRRLFIERISSPSCETARNVVNALTARIVCGGANNQLAHHGIEKLLADRGILYAPDYVVNSGGVIQVADELAGFSFERARGATEQIFVTTGKVLAIADADGVPPSVAADRLAERRMSEVGRLRGIWLGTMGSA